MRKTSFIITTSILTLTLFTFPPPAQASFVDFFAQFKDDPPPNFNQPPEPGRYGISSYLFEDPAQDDPSALQFLKHDSEDFEIFIDHASVLEITLNHEPEILGDGDPELLGGKHVEGLVDFGISREIENIALKNSALENNDISISEHMNSNIFGRYESFFHITCRHKYGDISENDCAAKEGVLNSKGNINTFKAITPLKRLLPPRVYYEQILQERAKKHKKCVEGTAPESVNCSNKYLIDKTGISSYDLAKRISSTSFEKYAQLSPEDRLLFNSLTTHELIPLISCASKHEKSESNPFDLPGFFNSMFGFDTSDAEEEPICGIAWIPKVPASCAQTTLNTKAQLDAETSQNFQSKKKSDAYRPIDKSAVDNVPDAIYEKLKQASKPLKDSVPFQSLGGYTETNPTPPDLPEIEFTIDDIAKLDDSIFSYTVSFIIPYELSCLEKDLTTLTSILMPSKYINYPDSNQKIKIGQSGRPIVSEPGTETVEDFCKDEDGNPTAETCTKEVPVVRVSYSEKKLPQGSTPEGATRDWVYKFQAMLPAKKSKDQYDQYRPKSTCWVNNLSSKTLKNIGSSNVYDLFSINSESCPDWLVASTPKILAKPTPTASNCSFDQVESSIDSAITTAAQKYTSLFPGLGLQKLANLLTEIYKNESLPYIAGADYSCEENSVSAAGPFQIKSETYRAVTNSCSNEYSSNDLTCEENDFMLSRCDPFDAAELAARILLYSKGHWIYTPDNCSPSVTNRATPITSMQDVYIAVCNYGEGFRNLKDLGYDYDGYYCDLVFERLDWPIDPSWRP